MTRKGRRDGDPTPTCPSCGLPIARPHGSEAACITALRAVLDRLQGRDAAAEVANVAREEELVRCQEALRELDEEIRILRNSALTFGDLADRLNRQLQILRQQSGNLSR